MVSRKLLALSTSTQIRDEATEYRIHKTTDGCSDIGTEDLSCLRPRLAETGRNCAHVHQDGPMHCDMNGTAARYLST